MKRWHWIFVTILAFFVAFYSFAYFFVIPKAAIVSMPYKWRNVGPGFKRSEYTIYLGRTSENKSFQQNTDSWIVKDENYTFYLQLHYNADSIVDDAKITYTFSNYLFYKEGIIADRKMGQEE
jgi:hypothetical protein